MDRGGCRLDVYPRGLGLVVNAYRRQRACSAATVEASKPTLAGVGDCKPGSDEVWFYDYTGPDGDEEWILDT